MSYGLSLEQHIDLKASQPRQRHAGDALAPRQPETGKPVAQDAGDHGFRALSSVGIHRFDAVVEQLTRHLAAHSSLIDRVIEQTPLTFRPQFTEDPPPNPPTLEWRRSELPFGFTYRVEVSLEDAAGTPNLVVWQDDIPSSALTHTLSAPLVPGNYTWTVWTVDEAGNRSRSKPAGFRVL